MRRKFCVFAVGIFATVGTTVLASNGDRTARLPWIGQAQLASVIVTPGNPLYPERCVGRPAAVVAGAGLTTLLGQLVAQQSHCLGDNGAFDLGEFTFTNTSGRTIHGKYHGQLVPAFPPPPGATPGAGIIQGRVCVAGGTAVSGIVNDCAADRYSPALGVLNLVTGDGAIIIDYALGLRR
jgi:hypothetical protein